MFHRGMLASGVDARIALIMYAAVYHFGPRWPRQMVTTLKAASADELGAIASRLSASNRKDEQPGKVGYMRTRALGDSGRTAVVKFEPKAQELTPQDFEALKRAIETKNLSLEDVENFRAASR